MPEANTKTKTDDKQNFTVDITGKTLRNMNEEEAIEYIKVNSQIAVSDKKSSFTRNARYNRVYEALDPEDTRVKEGSGNIEEDERLYANSYLPAVAAMVDTAAANGYNATMSHPDYIGGEAFEGKDDLIVMTKIIPHMKSNNREINFRHKIYQLFLQSACFDYAVSFSYWELQSGYIPERIESIEDVDFDGVKIPRRRIDMEMKWVPDQIDRFNIGVIEYADCAHDPNAKKGFEDSEYFFDWRWEQFGKLKGQEKTEAQPYGTYVNLDIVERKMKELKSSQLPSGRDTLPENGFIQDTNFIRRERVKVLRTWTKDHMVESVGSTIIRRQNYYRWPLHRWVYSLRNGKFNGISVIQRLERPQIDINADLSDRRDFWNIKLKPPWVVDNDLLEEEGGKIQVYSGKIFIKPSTTSGVQKRAQDMLYAPDIGGTAPLSTMAETNLSLDMMERMSGVNENTMGQFASGRRTAFEVGQVASGGAVRFGALVARVEDTALEEIFNDNFLYNQLFMTREVRIRNLGEESYYSRLVTPVDYKLTGGARFSARGSSKIQEDAIYKQQFMAMFDRFAQFPQFAVMPELMKKMAQLMVPKDYDKFVIDPAKGRDNIPPSFENQIMAGGNSVEVSPANDHAVHFADHTAFTQTGDYTLWPPARKRLMEDHLAQTQAAMAQGAAQAGGGARTNALGAGGAPSGNQSLRVESAGVTP